MQDEVLTTMKKRRSIYQLGKNVTQKPEEIVQLVEDIIMHSPTAFNGQTVRAVFLFGDNHDRLWDLTGARLKSEVPTEEAYQNTLAKLANFKAAFGTILFFRDQAIVTEEENNFPLYRDNFHDWSEQGQGGAQQAIWVALAQNGIGANLQHYNPLIDAEVAKTFDIPDNWVLRAQMPFGSIEGTASEKEFLPREDRFKTFF
ncbi:nitroreductase family protein [Schleiferilactobacillus perolens]|uniref:Nitroreductase family protein n=1 Tax=Schleiferilactobacillus perolens DSM 12744 TaxID=1423792 RepID=A0A0R1N195_9LACO|nr:nitroreductase family protein [Schleiferilactobacillus perolens]KRL14063.1 nitroreductase family protein [Schleiferilactobacillus perolens DSM 12744]MCI1890759.1 nitroreductase family protein [Schleiferilactobacillus harbinensis]MCI1912257.1 nitroreductase family protein [Schleiferilactobacillus harbinensis]MCI2171914.1 nitroreductase family protein [Schleiferilactobacillus perolens]